MNDQIYMQEAIKQAKIAAENDEVPVGAIVTQGNRIIAKAHNQIELLKDPTAHAEMIALTQATNTLAEKWLNNCCLYVTLEPCSMCAGAIVLARLQRVCFGAFDPKSGAAGSVVNILQNNKLNHQVEVAGGILEEVCGSFLTDFFRKKRQALN